MHAYITSRKRTILSMLLPDVCVFYLYNLLSHALCNKLVHVPKLTNLYMDEQCFSFSLFSRNLFILQYITLTYSGHQNCQFEIYNIHIHSYTRIDKLLFQFSGNSISSSSIIESFNTQFVSNNHN